MLFANFYNRSAIDKSKLVEACGDRSVIIYDARVNINSIIADAKSECIKRGFSAFALFKGERFTQCKQITEIIVLE